MEEPQSGLERRSMLKKTAAAVGAAGIGLSTTTEIAAAAASETDLEIRGLGSPASYFIKVRGNFGYRGADLEANDKLVTHRSKDEVYFTGEVADGGTDTYHYNTDIFYANVDGPVAIDPDDGITGNGSGVIEISGSANYTVRAPKGGLYPQNGNLENNDNFYDSHDGVRGEVRGGGKDSYSASGDISFIKFTDVGNSVTLRYR